MSEFYLETRVSKKPEDGHLEEFFSAPTAEVLFDLVVASIAREAIRTREALVPGEAKKKAVDAFHELANKENEDYDQRNNPANELYVVDSCEVGGAADPIKALGDHALEGGVIIAPDNRMSREAL